MAAHQCEPLLRNGRVLVVGSAPDLSIPTDYEFVIGVNGGAGLVRLQHKIDPDLLVTTAYLYRGAVSKQEEETQDLIGRVDRVLSVWIDGADHKVVNGLQHSKVNYGTIHSVAQEERLEQIQEGTGLSMPGRVSSGIWAICIARISGAKKVDYCGIEPGVVGHEGMAWDTAPRDHNQPDRVALSRLNSLGVKRVG
jgi:hypothetical protein